MNELLDRVLEAHGGLAHWHRLEKVEATIVSGGGLFALKGQPQDPSPRRMTVWLHEQRASLAPFGAADQRTAFTPERIAIETLDGRVLAERFAPKDSLAGHQLHTPWDPLQRAWFNGVALWTCLTTPFILTLDGVRVEEISPWKEGAETWRVLRAFFPGSIDTHCYMQDFYFGEDGLLRRHDYNVNAAGGFTAAQLTTNYLEAGGIRFPSRRRCYARGPNRQPIRELLMVAIDLSEVSFSGR